jgi:hypothetical protein
MAKKRSVKKQVTQAPVTNETGSRAANSSETNRNSKQALFNRGIVIPTDRGIVILTAAQRSGGTCIFFNSQGKPPALKLSAF